MKKNILKTVSVVLLVCVTYAYDKSIETTGTERERNWEVIAEKKFITSEVEKYKRNTKKLKQQGKSVMETEEEFIDRSREMFRRSNNKLRNMMKNDVSDIKFYGRIVDQSTNPIPNILVPFSLEHYNIFTAYKVTKYKLYTDNNGCFEITDAKGLELSFDKPIKEGYELVVDCRADTSYEYNKTLAKHNRHYPDPNKPVLFIMRKIPEKALMFKSTADISIKAFKNPIYDPIIWWEWKKTYIKGKGYFSKNMPQVKYTSYATSDENVYKITFELEPKGEFAWPNIETQKIIDKTSYYKLADRNSEVVKKAPLRGYQPEISVIFTNNTDTLKGLCFIKVPATKNITLYGKLIFRITNDADEPSPYINLRSTTYLNIEETRNLLYGDDLNYFEKLRIEEGEEKAKEYLEEKKKNSTLGRQKRKVADEYKLYE